MQFVPTAIAGVYIIEAQRFEDNRGFFMPTWSAAEFAAAGLDPLVAQTNLSWNRRKGTLRGMHFQHEPFAETKIVRCVRGAIFDQIVDLRRNSPTYLQSVGVELSAENRRAFYVPKGFAHGFQTLVDDTEVMYMVSAGYAPQAADGVRYNDPAFNLTWPLPVAEISAKDAEWPDYQR